MGLSHVRGSPIRHFHIVSGFESLGSEARTRLQASTSVRRKFLKHFHWSLNVYEGFDSSPSDAQKKNETSVVLSQGWSF
jgi:hypothetical protein